MTDIFQIASVGMQDANQRMDAISLNAASASLPGFRRHVVAGRPFTAALTGPTGPTGSSPNESAKAAVASLVGNSPAMQQVDLRPGSLISTGRPLDVALESDDLFFGLTDGERTWLTRAGSFRVNQDGVLVGEGGLRVVGTDGDLHVPSGAVTVEADGRITQLGITVATLQLFKPNDRTSIVAAQGSLLTAAAGEEPEDAGVGRVRAGALEGSNTDVASEMITLMTISRQFESLTRVVQGYDAALGRAIEKLAEV
jgi:flagellar basal body rod protein FlgG